MLQPFESDTSVQRGLENVHSVMIPWALLENLDP
jgi:hypothetical protein